MNILNWDNLLSTRRERKTNHQANSIIVRSEFDADYDRIVGSSAVRRLQDKAQVFPLQEDDVTRTRLTHSIEVSALACSLGKAVGKQLENRWQKNTLENKFTQKHTEDLSAVLKVAGLIHDLGNPPFGHYGETVIREWFQSWFKSTDVLSIHPPGLTLQQQKDFLCFDGNVQNLRIVSKLQVVNDTYGANFTYGTLGTIMKYPWPSDSSANKKDKFGYFESEQDLAKEVRKELGLQECVRHPATYLLEAADDIIYLCDDIEDGVKKGCIDWAGEYELIKKNLSPYPNMNTLFASIDGKYIDMRMPKKEQITAHVRNFRNAIQTFLFTRCVGQFLAKYSQIISNSPLLDFELLDCEPHLVNELKRVTRENCYCNKEVLALELEGHKILSSLLDTFVPCIISNTGKELLDTRTYGGKLFSLLSPNFVYRVLNSHKSKTDIDLELKNREKDPVAFQENQLDNLSLYNRLHLITDCISGMTDFYALKIYQELMGMRQPNF